MDTSSHNKHQLNVLGNIFTKFLTSCTFWLIQLATLSLEQNMEEKEIIIRNTLSYAIQNWKKLLSPHTLTWLKTITVVEVFEAPNLVISMCSSSWNPLNLSDNVLWQWGLKGKPKPLNSYLQIILLYFPDNYEGFYYAKEKQRKRFLFHYSPLPFFP